MDGATSAPHLPENLEGVIAGGLLIGQLFPARMSEVGVGSALLCVKRVQRDSVSERDSHFHMPKDSHVHVVACA